ncbi:hypothetical protein HDU85_007246 [Gaertneriomyces sp. JEL0708]|nr:hypothetical protein HDU85_007246 [Gaertneriomyces sp. JEL0708]
MGKKHIAPVTVVSGTPIEYDHKKLDNVSVIRSFQIDEEATTILKNRKFVDRDIKRYLLHLWYQTALKVPFQKNKTTGKERIKNRPKVLEQLGLEKNEHKKLDRFTKKLKNLKLIVNVIGADGKNVLLLTDLAGDGGGSFLRNLTEDEIQEAMLLLKRYEVEGIPSKTPGKWEWTPKQRARFRNLEKDDYERKNQEEGEDDDDYIDEEVDDDAEAGSDEGSNDGSDESSNATAE